MSCAVRDSRETNVCATVSVEATGCLVGSGGFCIKFPRESSRLPSISPYKAPCSDPHQPYALRCQRSSSAAEIL